jgi:hypothetical protein
LSMGVVEYGTGTQPLRYSDTQKPRSPESPEAK